MAPSVSILTALYLQGSWEKNNSKYKVVFDWEIRISDFAIERESENLLARPLFLRTVVQILFRISNRTVKLKLQKQISQR